MGNSHSSKSKQGSKKGHSERQSTSQCSQSTSSTDDNLTPKELETLTEVFRSLKKNVNGVDIIPEETFQVYIGLPKELNLPHILYGPFCRLPRIINGAQTEDVFGLTYECLKTSTVFYCEQNQKSDNRCGARMKVFFESLAEPTDGEEIQVSCGNIYDVFAGTFWVMKTYFANLLQDNLTGDQPHSPVTVPPNEPALDLVLSQLAIYQRKARGENNNFSVFSSDEMITSTVFEHFVKRNIPGILKVWRAYIYAKFYLGEAEGPRVGRHIFGDKEILPNFDFSSEILNLGNVCILTSFLPPSAVHGAGWSILYNGSEHGYSMNRLETRVFKYPGPTLLLVKVFVTKVQGSSKGNIAKGGEMILGAYVNEPWRFSKQFWGTNECQLFELSPQFEVFPSNNSNNAHVYCSASQGIGFGGKIGQHQLYFDNTFQAGKLLNDPLLDNITYTMSHSRPDFQIEFDIIEIEVIGLGGEQAKRQQNREWQFEEKEANRRGNVNLANKNQSRQILEMAGILDISAGEMETMRAQSEEK
ncbi:TLD-domain-containing protein [Basidiobolus meristosporus CBS 931.73]|uniref:TLD-domain-containing protein n=1 Tax=Basidiobolus meristosporus CBS 931.73 TaxID=1314790 RepID=A0A1Y1Y351_9FUNG|nr:TLD-domain-containing protein [Basidiobolus meristosporus CBS 931.73]|eukprot:ORX92024.1 TLD-domain-containing protein [Basidiobolus meristosporus CBS 931.73]